MSTKSTTIRISQATKERLEKLDFVRKDTFDQILVKLVDFYRKSRKNVKDTTKSNGKSTTIRISQITKERLENLDFVKKHTFDEIILSLIRQYGRGKK